MLPGCFRILLCYCLGTAMDCTICRARRRARRLRGLVCGFWRGRQGVDYGAFDAAAAFYQRQAQVGFESCPGGLDISFGKAELASNEP